MLESSFVVRMTYEAARVGGCADRQGYAITISGVDFGENASQLLSFLSLLPLEVLQADYIDATHSLSSPTFIVMSGVTRDASEFAIWKVALSCRSPTRASVPRRPSVLEICAQPCILLLARLSIHPTVTS
jgi:hypothetical protein